MNSAIFIILVIFGIGTATSNSLMSLGIYSWAALTLIFLCTRVGKDSLRDKSFCLGIVYFLYTIIALQLQTSWETWLGEFGSLFVFLGFVLAFAPLKSRMKASQLLRLDLIVGIAYVALWGICLYQVLVLGLDRADGIHKNPNRLACALLPPIIYYGQRLLNGAYLKPFKFAFFATLLALLFHAALLTKTRSIFPFVVIFGLYLLVTTVMRLKPSLKSPRTLLFAGVPALAILVAVLFSSTAKRFQFHSMLNEVNILARIEIWKINWQTFLSSPVWGVGFKQNLINVVDHPSLFPYVDMNVRGWFAHNIFLQVLTEGGVVGFLLFFGFLLMTAIQKPFSRWYIFAICTAGLAETILYIPRSMPAMIFFVALAGFAARGAEPEA